MEPRKLAMLGSGRVGTALGSGLVKHGHHVMLGSREPGAQRVTDWVAETGPRASAGTYREAVDWADWVFICVPGTAVDATIAAVGRDVFAGKIVVDVTNAMTSADDDHMTLSWGIEDSSAQHIQRAAPSARVVKAFNTTGAALMIDPDVPCAPPTMPICGNDASAKEAVSGLLRDVGWEPVDLGGIHSAPTIEAMTLAWVQYGRMTGTWNHAYKFTHR
jgi:8-hydroxy-5-deazaflavin:NADPH oxidoreductase